MKRVTSTNPHIYIINQTQIPANPCTQSVSSVFYQLHLQKFYNTY